MLMAALTSLVLHDAAGTVWARATIGRIRSTDNSHLNLVIGTIPYYQAISGFREILQIHFPL
jgi:hypothetical protein